MPSSSLSFFRSTLRILGNRNMRQRLFVTEIARDDAERKKARKGCCVVYSLKHMRAEYVWNEYPFIRALLFLLFFLLLSIPTFFAFFSTFSSHHFVYIPSNSKLVVVAPFCHIHYSGVNALPAAIPPGDTSATPSSLFGPFSSFLSSPLTSSNCTHCGLVVTRGGVETVIAKPLTTSTLAEMRADTAMLSHSWTEEAAGVGTTSSTFNPASSSPSSYLVWVRKRSNEQSCKLYLSHPSLHVMGSASALNVPSFIATPSHSLQQASHFSKRASAQLGLPLLSRGKYTKVFISGLRHGEDVTITSSTLPPPSLSSLPLFSPLRSPLSVEVEDSHLSSLRINMEEGNVRMKSVYVRGVTDVNVNKGIVEVEMNDDKCVHATSPSLCILGVEEDLIELFNTTAHINCPSPLSSPLNGSSEEEVAMRLTAAMGAVAVHRPSPSFIGSSSSSSSSNSAGEVRKVKVVDTVKGGMRVYNSSVDISADLNSLIETYQPDNILIEVEGVGVPNTQWRMGAADLYSSIQPQYLSPLTLRILNHPTLSLSSLLLPGFCPADPSLLLSECEEGGEGGVQSEVKVCSVVEVDESSSGQGDQSPPLSLFTHSHIGERLRQTFIALSRHDALHSYLNGIVPFMLVPPTYSKWRGEGNSSSTAPFSLAIELSSVDGVANYFLFDVSYLLSSSPILTFVVALSVGSSVFVTFYLLSRVVSMMAEKREDAMFDAIFLDVRVRSSLSRLFARSQVAERRGGRKLRALPSLWLEVVNSASLHVMQSTITEVEDIFEWEFIYRLYHLCTPIPTPSSSVLSIFKSHVYAKRGRGEGKMKEKRGKGRKEEEEKEKESDSSTSTSTERDEVGESEEDANQREKSGGKPAKSVVECGGSEEKREGGAGKNEKEGKKGRKETEEVEKKEEREDEKEMDDESTILPRPASSSLFPLLPSPPPPPPPPPPAPLSSSLSFDDMIWLFRSLMLTQKERSDPHLCDFVTHQIEDDARTLLSSLVLVKNKIDSWMVVDGIAQPKRGEGRGERGGNYHMQTTVEKVVAEHSRQSPLGLLMSIVAAFSILLFLSVPSLVWSSMILIDTWQIDATFSYLTSAHPRTTAVVSIVFGMVVTVLIAGVTSIVIAWSYPSSLGHHVSASLPHRQKDGGGRGRQREDERDGGNLDGMHSNSRVSSDSSSSNSSQGMIEGRREKEGREGERNRVGLRQRIVRPTSHIPPSAFPSRIEVRCDQREQVRREERGGKEISGVRDGRGGGVAHSEQSNVQTEMGMKKSYLHAHLIFDRFRTVLGFILLFASASSISYLILVAEWLVLGLILKPFTVLPFTVAVISFVLSISATHITLTVAARNVREHCVHEVVKYLAKHDSQNSTTTTARKRERVRAQRELRPLFLKYGVYEPHLFEREVVGGVYLALVLLFILLGSLTLVSVTDEEASEYFGAILSVMSSFLAYARSVVGLGVKEKQEAIVDEFQSIHEGGDLGIEGENTLEETLKEVEKIFGGRGNAGGSGESGVSGTGKAGERKQGRAVERGLRSGVQTSGTLTEAAKREEKKKGGFVQVYGGVGEHRHIAGQCVEKGEGSENTPAARVGAGLEAERLPSMSEKSSSSQMESGLGLRGEAILGGITVTQQEEALLESILAPAVDINDHDGLDV